MSPEKALDIRSRIADYKRTSNGQGLLDPVLDAFVDILDGKDTLPQETLTLRDHFAITAMNAIMQVPQPPGVRHEALAAAAYEMADMMIEARRTPSVNDIE